VFCGPVGPFELALAFFEPLWEARMRKKLTPLVLGQRAPAVGRVEIRDSESPLRFRITAEGGRSFTLRTRIDGEQVRFTYRKLATIDNLADARHWAREIVDNCRVGIDPRVTEETEVAVTAREAERAERRRFENIVNDYLERRVRREKKNRTADEVERSFAVYLLPKWRGRLITDISRKDVNDLLNDVFDCKIEFEGKKYGGQVAADHLLARMRACFNWYATQDDKFVSPIVRGMARTNPRERARSRVLTDEEIRALWPLLPAFDTFGGIVQMLLMTAQRRDEVAAMARSEISSGVWTLPASRYKTKRTQVVPLSKAAQAVVTSQNQIDNSDLVFTTTGKTAFSGFSKLKSRLDAAMLTKLRQAAAERGDDATKVTLPDWRLHDLRRTAKTLMARAGVRPDISERVLGHVIAGIEGVYDRYGYVEEKRAALEALAALLHRIVNPSTHNVVALREAAQ
jgi:hypothetical protein